MIAPLQHTRSCLFTLGLVTWAMTASPLLMGATLQLNRTAHSNEGGVFAITQADGLDVSHYSHLALYTATTGDRQIGFGTFCLEYNEPFNPGDIFDYTVASFANGGGVGGQTSPGQDPLSLGTAWIYSLFATGTLGDHSDFSYSSTTNLRSLQKAFWFLEDEGQGNISNAYVQLAVLQFGTLDAAKADANGAFGVSVLNLSKNGQLKQSQLFFGGVPQSVTDEATTAWLLAGALASLSLYRRFRTK